MGKKYICEVKKDHNSLELVNHENYSTNNSSGNEITFASKNDFNNYINNHCISEDDLNNNNSIFIFLFWLLLFILIIMIVVQLIIKSRSTIKPPVSEFGRFTF